MANFSAITVNDKTYYYDGKHFFDEYFLVLQGTELHEVVEAYFGGIEYHSMKADELYEFAKLLKKQGLYSKSKEVMTYGMEKFNENDDFIYRVLPVFTSCCREMNNPSLAIQVAESYYPVIERLWHCVLRLRRLAVI